MAWSIIQSLVSVIICVPIHAFVVIVSPIGAYHRSILFRFQQSACSSCTHADCGPIIAHNITHIHLYLARQWINTMCITVHVCVCYASRTILFMRELLVYYLITCIVTIIITFVNSVMDIIVNFLYQYFRYL